MIRFNVKLYKKRQTKIGWTSALVTGSFASSAHTDTESKSPKLPAFLIVVCDFKKKSVIMLEHRGLLLIVKSNLFKYVSINQIVWFCVFFSSANNMPHTENNIFSILLSALCVCTYFDCHDNRICRCKYTCALDAPNMILLKIRVEVEKLRSRSLSLVILLLYISC